MRELADRRILGAFRVVDAMTGTAVSRAFGVAGAPLMLMRNRSGIFVVREAPRMHHVTTRFDLQGVPAVAPQSFELALWDDSRLYLGRRFQLQIPRSVPEDASMRLIEPSLLVAKRVELYPNPAAATAPTWAVIRVSVVQKVSPAKGLPWSLIRVKQKSDNTTLKIGISDERGEALVSILGLTMHARAGVGGSVMSSETDVVVEAIFDPEHLKKPPEYLPDPDDLKGRADTPAMKRDHQEKTIASGRTERVTIKIAL